MLESKHKYMSAFPNSGIKSKTWGLYTMNRRRKRSREEPLAWPLAHFSSENTSNTESKCKEPRGRDAFRGLAMIWGRQHKYQWWFLDAIAGKATVSRARSAAQPRGEDSQGYTGSLPQSTRMSHRLCWCKDLELVSKATKITKSDKQQLLLMHTGQQGPPAREAS